MPFKLPLGTPWSAKLPFTQATLRSLLPRLVRNPTRYYPNFLNFIALPFNHLLYLYSHRFAPAPQPLLSMRLSFSVSLVAATAVLLLSAPAHAGTVISTNLPAGTEIVNINAQADGAGSYSGDTDQSFWYQPTSTAPSITVPAGTYTFRVTDPADAVTAFPALTTAQQGQLYTAWTYNSPWTEDYLAFASTALTNTSENQLFDGALPPGIPNNQTFGSAQGAYDGTVADGYYNKIRPAPPGRSGDASTYLTQYTFTAPTTLLFVVPDNVLGDNNGGVSVVVTSVVPEPATSAALAVGAACLLLVLRRRVSA